MDGDRASTGVGVVLMSNRGGGPGTSRTIIKLSFPELGSTNMHELLIQNAARTSHVYVIGRCLFDSANIPDLNISFRLDLMSIKVNALPHTLPSSPWGFSYKIYINKRLWFMIDFFYKLAMLNRHSKARY